MPMKKIYSFISWVAYTAMVGFGMFLAAFCSEREYDKQLYLQQ